MDYIVFDLEFNQDFSSPMQVSIDQTPHPFEIIQIGAVKLDEQFNTIDTFNRFVKPSIYANINPYVTKMTNITAEMLLNEKSFPEVYRDFTDFAKSSDAVFCIWGMSDIRELFKNIEYHRLPNELSSMYINIQSLASLHFNLPQHRPMGLHEAVELLKIPATLQFHNAYCDAYYTAEIFKKIYNASVLPKLYDPAFKQVRTRHRKREIDFEKLISQFEKMFSRKMSPDEQKIIRLAYKMGRTHQFLKKQDPD